MEVQSILSEKGEKLLVFDNYKFHKGYVAKSGKVLWRCIKNGCHAKVYTPSFDSNVVIDQDLNHNHTRDLNIARQAVNNNAKRKAMEEVFARPSRIIHSELETNVFSTGITSRDLGCIRKNVYGARRTVLLNLSLPKEQEEVSENTTDQQIKSELKESTGEQDVRPYSYTTTNIFPENSSGTSALKEHCQITLNTSELQYLIDRAIESRLAPALEKNRAEVKQDINLLQVSMNSLSSKIDLFSTKLQNVENRVETMEAHIHSLQAALSERRDTNASTVSTEKALGTSSQEREKYLQNPKEEISSYILLPDLERNYRGECDHLSERNHSDKKGVNTIISSDNNSTSKDLTCIIEHDNDETLKIKGEIIQDQERHHRGGEIMPSEEYRFEEKYIKTEIPSDNNSGADILTTIEYNNDESLDIKEEIIQDQGTVTGQKSDEKYQKKLCAVNTTGEADIFADKNDVISKTKQKIQDLKPKRIFKCPKCARTYKWRENLRRHKKFECDVMPQFTCTFCSKRFKRKSHMIIHINQMHLKTNPKTIEMNYNCDNCPRSYSSIVSLRRHKRLEHAEVKPQFTCDICGHITNSKSDLSRHIISRHVERVRQKRNSEPSVRHQCDKCSLSYTLIKSLNVHKRHKHAEIKP
ncbi:zinc finger and SCAN domain containing protein 4D-like [Belonocnema kinseyi]|uniref:zinc finger and SCAN domain containing protein 4D-like n=1 Tax=Belonocnema kinseyi TaxID=2817044 RepID=UPI00143D9989|nr:zinc finger and SCAN domain containing protein 4D-like [Belonocnema kinseyi]